MSRLTQSAKQAAAEAQAKKDKLEAGLPHLFGRKWYSWARQFFDSTNKMNLLCAANQISKSSTQIRKAIHWATCPKVWPRLWADSPRQFWYLYPSKDVATIEWEQKWVPEFMPRHEYKDHPVYGWTEEWDKKHIHSVTFNSGVTIYFKTYAQDVHTLQSGTCHAIFCDEELPEDLYDELKARLFGTDGYFHMVFTATRNQIMWLRAIEGRGDDTLFPNAFKIQISMADCQWYTDGTPGAFNEDKIARIIADCKNKTEVLRRVFGRFVRESGRVYSEFDPLRHFKKPVAIPKDWFIFGALDGGGGGEGHPGAWSLLAVRPDFRLGYLFKGWKGNESEITTAGDIVEKYLLGRAQYRPMRTVYDWASKDMGTIAGRLGESFEPAEKSHVIGEDFVNTLFKNNMLFIFDTQELRPLGTELMTVMTATVKRHRKDDLSDTLRYAVAAVPWDWTAIQNTESETEREKKEKERPWTPADQAAWEIEQRRGTARGRTAEGDEDPLEDEIGFWNDQYGT